MGASASHQAQKAESFERPLSPTEHNKSANVTPVKEKTDTANQKQRRKTFSSLGIRGSFDFRGASFDIGSSKSDRHPTLLEKEKPEDLTERQKELLVETWTELEKNIAQVGVITFVSLFETHPDVQQSFMPFTGIEIEDLKHSKQLRAHALRVMAFIQKAIARLNEPEKLQVLLVELGKKHVSYGARQKYIELVGPQFMKAIKPSLEDRWSDDIQEAWNQLFKIIEYIMVNAMDDEQRRIKSTKE